MVLRLLKRLLHFHYIYGYKMLNLYVPMKIFYKLYLTEPLRQVPSGDCKQNYYNDNLRAMLTMATS